MREVVVSTTGPLGNDAHIHLMDGTEIKGVTAATVRLASGELTVLELEVYSPVVSVHAHVNEVLFTCPVCSHSETHRCDGDTLGGP